MCGRLEQLIGTVCRKTARKVAEGRLKPGDKLVVTPEVVHEFLGGIKVRVDTEIAERTKRAGVAVGWRGRRRAATSCSSKRTR